MIPQKVIRHPADGGLLHRRRVHEPVPAHLQDELPRDRGHRAAGGRRLPQPRLREHPQGLTKGPSDVLDHATS